MAVNPKSIENLNPAKSGDIRNPKGKPKGTPNTKTVLKRLLSVVITDRESGQKMTVHEQMLSSLLQKAKDGDRRSIKEILDRFEGKPAQSIEVKELTIDDLESLTEEQLKERAKAIMKKMNDNSTQRTTTD